MEAPRIALHARYLKTAIPLITDLPLRVVAACRAPYSATTTTAALILRRRGALSDSPMHDLGDEHEMKYDTD